MFGGVDKDYYQEGLNWVPLDKIADQHINMDQQASPEGYLGVMLPHVYIVTQADSQTHSQQTYTPPTMTHTDTRHNNKHTSRHTHVNTSAGT